MRIPNFLTTFLLLILNRNVFEPNRNLRSKTLNGGSKTLNGGSKTLNVGSKTLNEEFIEEQEHLSASIYLIIQ